MDIEYVKDEMRELIQIIKYYQKNNFEIDEDEVEKRLNYLIEKYNLYGE